MDFKSFSASFLAFSVFLSIFGTIAFAQIASNYPQFPFQTWFSPEALATFLGVPQEWLGVPQVIYYVFIPFIVAFTVTYGILTELQIFRRFGAYKINIVLAFAMAFLLLPSGVLTIIVTYFYAANTFIGLIGFGLLFLIGTLLWVYGRARLMRYEFGYKASSAKTLQDKINDLDKKEEILRQQLIHANASGDKNRVNKINNDLAKVHNEQDEAKKRLKDVINA